MKFFEKWFDSYFKVNNTRVTELRIGFLFLFLVKEHHWIYWIFGTIRVLSL